MQENGKALAERFAKTSIKELEGLLQSAESREEKALFRALLNLKIQLRQEEIIGEVLV